MCAEYEIRKNKKAIEDALSFEIGGEGSDFPIRNRIRLFQPAPILTGRDGALELEQMCFSLKPPSVKFATFNARMLDFDEREGRVTHIFEKPTWKLPFQNSRCLVPMDGFIEPIYHGEYAGEMVEFSDRNDQLLLAAGIYAQSKDPKTGADYVGYSIIMHTPDETVQKVGHHRTPLFLKRDAVEDWLFGEMSSEERFEFLLKKRQALELLVKADRKMARGWEKRIATIEAKFEKEKNTEAMIESWLKRKR